MASIGVGIRHGERHSHHICIFGGATIVPIFEDAAHQSRTRSEAIGPPNDGCQQFLREGTNSHFRGSYHHGACSDRCAANVVGDRQLGLPKAIRWTSREYAAYQRSPRLGLQYSQFVGNGPVWRSSAYAKLVPLGYAERLRRVARTVDRDIDVLFYGYLNHRRMQRAAAMRGARSSSTLQGNPVLARRATRCSDVASCCSTLAW